MCQEFESADSDERVVLNDYRHCSSYLMELNVVWNKDMNKKVVGDDYCKHLSRSSAMLDTAPVQFTASESKQAAYLIKQKRDPNDDLLEIEIPYNLLLDEERKKSETPKPDEIVVLQIDRKTDGHVYLIERELPILTKEDLVKYSKEVESSIAAEWAS